MIADLQQILVAVMSYNRGPYLKNCIASIQRHMPGAKIAIFDDNSSDPETQKILAELGRNIEVNVNQTAGSNSHLKGLYHNMNKALDRAQELSKEYVFFVQDDQQLVRPFDKTFWKEILDIFQSREDLCQVIPVFFKGFWPESQLKARFQTVEPAGYYIESTYGIADIGIVHLSRLLKKNFRFKNSEGESSSHAFSLGLRTAHCRNPIFMYTPWPRVFRKIKNPIVRWAADLNQLGVNTGCHPFKDMSDEKIQLLLSRPIHEFPKAENFLETYSKLRKPWWYSDPFNIEKIRQLKHLIRFDWLLSGTSDYIKLKTQAESEEKL